MWILPAPSKKPTTTGHDSCGFNHCSSRNIKAGICLSAKSEVSPTPPILPQPPRLDRANHQSEHVYVAARQPAPRLALSRTEPPRPPLELLPLYSARPRIADHRNYYATILFIVDSFCWDTYDCAASTTEDATGNFKKFVRYLLSDIGLPPRAPLKRPRTPPLPRTLPVEVWTARWLGVVRDNR